MARCSSRQCDGADDLHLGNFQDACCGGSWPIGGFRVTCKGHWFSRICKCAQLEYNNVVVDTCVVSSSQMDLSEKPSRSSA